jgi:hypothetical protein
MPNASQAAAVQADLFTNPGIIEVLDDICRAEGVNLPDMRSIHEITVQFMRANGVVRVSTHPLTALPAVRRYDADLSLEIK